MALSPWPTTPAALTTATATLKAALDPTENAPDDATVQRIGATAAVLVERYAPAAPDPVKDEAVIRCSGWLLDAPATGIRSDSAGPFTTNHTPSMFSALRHSGAMALLTTWKVRRAGVIA